MKKTLLTLALVIVTVITVSAQNAEAIVKRYLKATNIESLTTTKDMSFMMDMTMNVDNAGQKMVMPVKMISKAPDKMNMSMKMAGQDMLIVVNGSQGWLKMGGMVQALPAEQMKQFTEQTNVMDNFKFDLNKFKAEYVGEKNGIQTVKLTDKTGTAKVKEQVLGFDTKTGLLSSIDANTQGMDVTTKMKDYKKFGDVLMPTNMEVLVGGKVVSTIVINKFEVDFPTQEFMFVEPK